MSKNAGKFFENKVSQVFREWCVQNHGFFYKFPDTYMARNVLSTQPGDFLWLIPDKAILLECKSTEIGANVWDMAKKTQTQMAKHRLWHRSGHPSAYLHCDLRSREVSVVSGLDVIEGNKNKVWEGTISVLAESIVTLIHHFTNNNGR